MRVKYNESDAPQDPLDSSTVSVQGFGIIGSQLTTSRPRRWTYHAGGPITTQERNFAKLITITLCVTLFITFIILR